MSHQIFELDSYTIRRKVFKVLGAGFQVFDEHDRQVGYSEQKAFRLKEDIRVHAGEGETGELIRIKARSIIDFSSAYDVVDGETGELIGGARRKGLASMLRDSWELYDPEQRVVAVLKEDSQFKALLRRFLTIIPQTFGLVPRGDSAGEQTVVIRQRFNLVVYKLDIDIPPACELDRRLIFAAAVLIAAIEGRQE